MAADPVVAITRITGLWALQNLLLNPTVVRDWLLAKEHNIAGHSSLYSLIRNLYFVASGGSMGDTGCLNGFPSMLGVRIGPCLGLYMM